MNTSSLPFETDLQRCIGKDGGRCHCPCLYCLYSTVCAESTSAACCIERLIAPWRHTTKHGCSSQAELSAEHCFVAQCNTCPVNLKVTSMSLLVTISKQKSSHNNCYHSMKMLRGTMPQSELGETRLPESWQSVRLDGCHKSRLWAQGMLVVRLLLLPGNGTSQLRSQTPHLHSRQKLMQQPLPCHAPYIGIKSVVELACCWSQAHSTDNAG